MKLPKIIKPLSGVLCLLLLAGVVMAALYLDSLSPDPIFGVFHPEPTRTSKTTTTTAQMTTMEKDSAETSVSTENGETVTTVSGGEDDATTSAAVADGDDSTTTTVVEEDDSTMTGATQEKGTTTVAGEDTPTTMGTADNEVSTTTAKVEDGTSVTQTTVAQIGVTTSAMGTSAGTTVAGESMASTTSTKTTDSTSTTRSTETVNSTTTTRPTETEEEPVDPPGVLPPVVDLPTEEDPETGETELTFPCTVPGYGLVIERLAPYNGMYVEDGTNATVQNVAMLLLSHQGDQPIEYAQIAVQYGDETLLFDVSALPIGEKLVVQEKNGKSVPEDKAEAATAMVVRKADLEMSLDTIEVVDNGDNTLTIRNLTDKMIPTVRVFYKYYMEDQDVFVGGIAFTVRITRLEANGSVTIQPSHYSSSTGRVVMVLTYDSEV